MAASEPEQPAPKGRTPDESPGDCGRLAYVDPYGRVCLHTPGSGIDYLPLPGRPVGLPVEGDLPRHTRPGWSPDRRYLAAPGSKEHGGEGGLFIFDLHAPDTARWIPIDTPPIYAFWLPKHPSLGVLIPRPDGLSLEVLEGLGRTSPRRELFHGMPLFAHRRPHGNDLALHLGDTDQPNRRRVILVDPEDVQQAKVLTQTAGNLRAPTWSRDGQLLAYGVALDEETSELVVMDSGGRQIRPGVRFTGPGAASFSPDGNTLVLSAGTVGKLPLLAQAALIPVWGGVPRLIYDGPICCVAWVDNESLVAVVNDSSGARWVRLDPTGGSPLALSPIIEPTPDAVFYAQFFDQFAHSHPLVSPDGHWLAYFTHGQGLRGVPAPLIYLVDLTTTSEPILVGEGLTPAWAMGPVS